MYKLHTALLNLDNNDAALDDFKRVKATIQQEWESLTVLLRRYYQYADEYSLYQQIAGNASPSKGGSALSNIVATAHLLSLGLSPTCVTILKTAW